MCGVAGYSLARDLDLDTTMLAKLLMAGLAERGEDASGYAYRHPDGSIQVRKRAAPFPTFVAEVDIPRGSRQALLHIRDHTKGTPTIEANNHPIVHGRVCGVHNGIIQNDDELFRAQERERAMPGMTVDSEAIFMLADVTDSPVDALAPLVGSYTCAWLDDRHPEQLVLARGEGRPLALAQADGLSVFASTRSALSFALETIGLTARITTVPQRTLLVLQDGDVLSRQRLHVQPFVERATTSYNSGSRVARMARRLVEHEFQSALKAASPHPST